MKNSKVNNWIQKYAMIMVLILVVIIFSAVTKGKLLLPQNITNLIAQNAYVFVLATGMLLCILTGGNIDLSVGSVVCFVGAIGGVMLKRGMPLLDCLRPRPALHHHPVRHARLPRPVQRCAPGQVHPHPQQDLR